MRCTLGIVALICLAIGGCGEQPQSGPAAAPSAASASATDAGGATTTSTGAPAAGDGTKSAAPVEITISPENTSITFVGTHAPPKEKEPRTGTFEKFSGTAEVDNAKQQIKSLKVEIDTTSLKTGLEDESLNSKLANHLKSPDFLDVEQYPTAKFESTKIEYGTKGAHTVTGNLTLHGKTKEITFPARLANANFAMNFSADIEIDRMDFGVGDSDAGKGVERPVVIKVTIGKPPGAN